MEHPRSASRRAFLIRTLSFSVSGTALIHAAASAQNQGATPRRSTPPLRTASLPASSGQLAKFEPAQGCYIGAFIELDHIVKGKIDEFESLTQKKHASYFTYCGYGMPFPK